MSDYELYQSEIDKIEALLLEGYKVETIYENLSGMFIEMTCQEQMRRLHLLTADGRKYFSAKIKEQLAAS